MKTHKETIQPSLFQIITEHTMYYIVAYDAAHAITSLINEWSSEKDIKSVTKLTDDWSKCLFVTKECLPQGLVNKTVTKAK
jgi:hypothetical protein